MPLPPEYLSSTRTLLAKLGTFLPFIVALLIYTLVLRIMHPIPTTDEPHYLMVAYSIAYDLDLDLSNQYYGDAVKLYLGSTETSGVDHHTRDYRGTGERISVRPVGLAMLLAPVVRLQPAPVAAQMLMVLLTALLSFQLMLLLRATAWATGWRLWLIWAGVSFSMPIVVYSTQIFPEIPAAILIIVSARYLISMEMRYRHTLFIGLSCAVLPWLHTRYVTIAAGLFVCFLLSLRRISTRQMLAKALAISCLPIIVSVILIVAFSLRYYGGLTPASAISTPSGGLYTLSSLYRYGLGALFSTSYGWLPFSPIAWLGIAAIVPTVARFRWTCLAPLATICVYIASIGHNDGVAGLAGRYVVVIAPLVVLPLLYVVGRSGIIATGAIAIAGISWMIAGVAVQHHYDLHPLVRTGTTLPLIRHLQSVWPSYWEPGYDGFRMIPGKSLRRTGQVDDVDEEVIHAVSGRDAAGHLLYGPYASLTRGSYLARIVVAVDGVVSDQPPIAFEVVSSEGVHAQRILSLADLQPMGTYRTAELPFASDIVHMVQLRVYWSGEGEVWLKSAEVKSMQINQFDGFPSLSQSVFWCLFTLFVGLLMTHGCSTTSRRDVSMQKEVFSG